MRSFESAAVPIGDGERAQQGRGPAMPPVGERAGLDLDVTAVVRDLDLLWDRVRRRGVTRIPAPDADAAIGVVAQSARRCGLRPEQFLWLVKETWAALPEVRTAADPLATREILSRIITVCIHEFYRE